ncbi:hypothetical protein [Thermoleptolyngbya sp. M55_K2018_002]|nr:hypothetical protein [Thermoleptolyngbya sp. M55_K2018_002]HIK41976.1 hypothetical protein [Thermoleptolyngbya sp. M55_K2018_002]
MELANTSGLRLGLRGLSCCDRRSGAARLGRQSLGSPLVQPASAAR